MDHNQAILITSITPTDLESLIHSAVEQAFARREESQAEEELLPLNAVCKKLSISASTLHSWSKSLSIPKYKMGGSNKTFFKYSEITAALKIIRPYAKKFKI